MLRFIQTLRVRVRERFARLSIRAKLVLVVSVATILSLLAGFGAVVPTSLEQFRVDLIRSTEITARAVGNYSAVALAFDDRNEARSALEPLRDFESITDAYLYDLDGSLFETWTRNSGLSLPAKVLDMHSEIRDGSVHIFRPVVFDGRRYGTIYVRASAESLISRQRTYLLFVSLLMAGLVLLSMVVAFGLQGLISRPILALAAMARHISDHADYSVRMEKPSNDEIGVLYEGFNAMLEQIGQRQEELQRSNRDLDQFAYVASHDLKAPLRAISTLSAWIEEDLHDKIGDEGREQLRLLRSRVQRMDALIEGILQYSRAGRLATGVAIVDTGQMVRELIQFLDLPEGMKIFVGSDMPVLQTRRLRLEQVMQNLISNAIKYHHDPAHGHIEIGHRREGDLWRFWVSDDGPGIAPEHHERVFLMFQTLQPRDRVESTGLGLSLVTKLVEEEGGKVTLHSDVGQGARFEFTWPAMPADVRPADRASSAQRADGQDAHAEPAPKDQSIKVASAT